MNLQSSRSSRLLVTAAFFFPILILLGGVVFFVFLTLGGGSSSELDSVPSESSSDSSVSSSDVSVSDCTQGDKRKDSDILLREGGREWDVGLRERRLVLGSWDGLRDAGLDKIVRFFQGREGGRDVALRERGGLLLGNRDNLRELSWFE